MVQYQKMAYTFIYIHIHDIYIGIDHDLVHTLHILYALHTHYTVASHIHSA